MIKPSALWALFKQCEDSKWLGEVCRSIGKQDVVLDYGQSMVVKQIQQESEWLDELVEGQRERWRDRQREHRSRVQSEQQNVTVTTECHGDKGDSRHVTECHGDTPPVTESHVIPTNLPTNLPTNQPFHSIRNDPNGSHSIPLGFPFPSSADGMGNGMEPQKRFKGGLGEEERAFLAELKQDKYIIHDPSFDPVVICNAVVGTRQSARRWKQMVETKGEQAVRDEVFQFYCELQGGESVRNRGGALNARLARLSDQQV